MSKHVIEWLGAYQDGELNGARLKQVEEHLTVCAECRADLDRLQGISALLHETAGTPEFIPTERFVANLMLNLPRQPERLQSRKILEIGWWLLPVGLLGIWVFLQITNSLSSLALIASNTGLLGSNFAWLQGSQAETGWFAALMNLSGGQIDVFLRAVLSYLNNSNVFIENLADQIGLQIFIAILYLGWLAAWWLGHQQPSTNVGTFSRS